MSRDNHVKSLATPHLFRALVKAFFRDDVSGEFSAPSGLKSVCARLGGGGGGFFFTFGDNLRTLLYMSLSQDRTKSASHSSKTY